MTNIKQIQNNQFQITTKNGSYFQSYQTVVAHKDNNGKVTLSKEWCISKTTLKYLKIFLGTELTKKDLQKETENGTFKVVDEIIIE